MTPRLKASHRKNGSYGYKALVIRSNGTTYQPASKNFATADLARACAQSWIDANMARDGWTPADYAAENKRKNDAALAEMRKLAGQG